jgi:predicted RNA binding protein YcfA (HicA-like mRNA interferase family)
MKRRELLHHLTEHGCEFLREGKRHTIYYNPTNKKVSTVPRHSEVDDALVEKICKDLEIPLP